ncbi:MAG TPA: hypothetical protein PKA96_00765 [Candidatus Paceibacterota bacterium]|nr:hypothetical protein [Candidatus Paceibacterota bacterium]HMP85451.1 hypothetical protein [Candidatus Paceibacterota bacterium]
MNYFDRKKTQKIDALEKKLYSKSAKQEGDIRKNFDKRRYPELDDDWTPNDQVHDLEKVDEDEDLIYEVEKPKTGLFWSVLSIAVLFFLGSIIYAGYVLLDTQRNNVLEDISINVVGPSSVGSGNRLSVDIVVQNNSKNTLEAAHLVFEYPKGTRTPDMREEIARDRIVLGNMEPGSVIKRTIDIALLGENGETKKIDLKVEYRLPGSLALFNKFKPFEIVLSQPPVQVLVNALEKTSSGQTIDINLTVKSNSSSDIPEILLVGNYPFGFKFMSASVKPNYGNDVWVIKNLKPNESREIKVTGQIEAQDREQRVFRFSIGTPKSENVEEISVVLNNVSHIVLIERPFLDLQLVIDNQVSGAIASVQSGNQFSADVIFVNNTNDIIRDVEIDLFFEGIALDKAGMAIRGGFYSSFENRASFNKDTTEQLTQVLPRQSVRLSNTFKTIDLFSNNRNMTNPEIKISSIVRGRRIRESGADEKINQENLFIVRVLSDLHLSTKNNRGKVEGISDFGPIPPRVDLETSYSINWSVSNSTNEMENVVVSARLPSYVRFSDIIVPTGQNISYDQYSRRINWNIGNLTSGVGYGNIQPKTINFQLVLRPSISQRGKGAVLLDQINISGFDKFNQRTVTKNFDDLDTSIFGRSVSDYHHFITQ